MNKQDTKQTLLQIGLQLISRNGYNHTGLNDVLKEADIPKGSFYYYFDSKEDFALQVLDSFAVRNKTRRESFLHDESLDPLSRLRAYFDWYIDYLASINCSLGCLLGNLGQELSDQNETFRLQIDDHMTAFANDLESCLMAAQRAGQINAALNVPELAAFCYNSWQGAMLRMKVAKSVEPLRTFTDMLFNVILK